MMDKLKKNMVFYLLLLIDFYIVPWFIKNTGSAMIVMLVIIPLICLITSVSTGVSRCFSSYIFDFHCIRKIRVEENKHLVCHKGGMIFCIDIT